MRLELASYQVNRIAFGGQTQFVDDSLEINRAALAEILGRDSAIAGVEIEIAHPGDPVRIVNILDSIEPRWKASGHGRIFSGFLGAPDTVGAGRTHRLAGMALMAAARPPEPTTGLLQPREAVLDMSGPVASYSPFSETANLVVTFHPAAGVDNAEFDNGLRCASLQAAEYLAQATDGGTPDEMQTLQLDETDEALPRIAYLCQAQSQGIYSDTYLYGKPIFDMVPTMIHPNEVLDGALVSGNYVYGCFKNPTYLHCNNPVIQALYAEHGKSLNFVGVVLYRGHNYTQAEKHRAGHYAAKLASFLRADGVVLTGEGGGNSAIDMFIALQECERLGMKTTVITYELGGPKGQDFPLVHSVPEADAIVSAGSVDKTIGLPEMPVALGGSSYADTGEPATKAREVLFDHLYCVANQLGAGNMMAEAV
ncbi:MAG: glycine/sarcosine/betaine reductase component B subunit [Anaerolineales bacterium]|jgi:glycine reductase|nr:glycine/sarcosine/betaine reductase component B subunit [Anaerolineales bacterium]|tara:strand:+ start:7765 stop:9036 length:1272 start_codon:yes stop_codon:yes gene_type:complete